nr:DNA binding protein [Neodiprion sertifer nucleopolyhedrovirus]
MENSSEVAVISNEIIKYEDGRKSFVNELIDNLRLGKVHMRLTDINEHFSFPFDKISEIVSPDALYNVKQWGCIAPTDKKTTYKIGLHLHGGVKPTIIWQCVNVKGGTGQYGDYLCVHCNLPDKLMKLITTLYCKVNRLKTDIFVEPTTFLNMSKNEFLKKCYKISSYNNMFLMNGDEWNPENGLNVTSCTENDVNPFDETSVDLLMGAELFGLKKKPEVMINMYEDDETTVIVEPEKPVALDFKPFIFLSI